MNDGSVRAEPAPPVISAPEADRVWWRAVPALVVALTWILGWYWQTAVAMVGIWARSDTFAHGFVVPPIVVWLAWRNRARLTGLVPRPNWWALGGILLVGFVWLCGELAAVNAVSQLALIALLVLTVPAVLGSQVARAMAFPLAFLFFAAPVGEFFLPQLMEWTASFTVIGLRLSGVPVYREGLQFVIPSGSWSVVEACSGVRYLIASVTVGTLYAYLTYRSLRRRVAFVVASIVVAIVANWVRAYMIVMLGHLSGNRLAVGVDHLIYGWLFFGLVIMLIFWLGSRWREDGADTAPTPRIAAAPQLARSDSYWYVAAAVAALTSLWPLGNAAIERADASTQPRLGVLVATGGWQMEGDAVVDWRPHFDGQSAELQEVFRKEGQAVGLFIGYYRNQDYAHKMVSSENVLVKSNDPVWARVASGWHEIDIDRRPVAVRTTELRGAGNQRLVVWQWYWINGRATASDPWAKGYTALSRLEGLGDDSAVVIVYAPKETPGGGGDAALASFVNAYAPTIEAILAQTRVQR